jgi:hypothetical protein
MTLLELRTQCRKRLGDVTSAYWTDAELNKYINEALRDISFKTKSIKDNGYITVTGCESSTVSEKVREWTLSVTFPDILSVEDAYFQMDGTKWDKLIPMSREALDSENPAWYSNVGYTSTARFIATTEIDYNFNSQPSTPRYYYWDREEDLIGIDPPPNAQNAGANFRVFYTKLQPDLTVDTDEPVLPENVHKIAINYVAALGYEDRGWGERANDQWEKYYQKLRDYEIEIDREREDEEIIMRSYKNV